MDALRQLVVLCVCGAALGEPLGEALRRYSRHGVYAGEYSRGYSPYMYAAVPLHAPVPVLRVLTSAPLLPRDPALAPSAHSPVYARAPYDDDQDDYDEPQQYAAYAHRYQTPQLYAAASSAPEEPAVLYARPTAHGGYTYHSAPHKPAGKRAPADLPYIIRVHKYKIVKDR
ncbi:hypothetical protein B5X24_HaOG211245 [Helicoverpa armigera]|uniref:Uncharacterized protein n=1 Tax=Helicoverpa armigera TaxID=29058 RepID=A0A2W1BDE0_HELAM|nr:hypothetical protein B5X24_HaOG211245 [Helicoverpa armigera]